MGQAVLIIDDDPIIRTFADMILTQAGYQVVLAGGAGDGLRILEHTRIALVLLDIMLPDMPGVKALEVLRRRKNKVPVVMMTAKGDLGTVKACLAVGATGYLVKPFTSADLLKRASAALAPAAPSTPSAATQGVDDVKYL